MINMECLVHCGDIGKPGTQDERKTPLKFDPANTVLLCQYWSTKNTMIVIKTKPEN